MKVLRARALTGFFSQPADPDHRWPSNAVVDRFERGHCVLALDDAPNGCSLVVDDNGRVGFVYRDLLEEIR